MNYRIIIHRPGHEKNLQNHCQDLSGLNKLLRDYQSHYQGHHVSASMKLWLDIPLIKAHADNDETKPYILQLAKLPGICITFDDNLPSGTVLIIDQAASKAIADDLQVGDIGQATEEDSPSETVPSRRETNPFGHWEPSNSGPANK